MHRLFSARNVNNKAETSQPSQQVKQCESVNQGRLSTLRESVLVHVVLEATESEWGRGNSVCNRRQLMFTQEPYPQELSEPYPQELSNPDTAAGMQSASGNSDERPERTPIMHEPAEPVSPPPAAARGPVEPEITTPPLRRSVRVCKPPDSYVPS